MTLASVSFSVLIEKVIKMSQLLPCIVRSVIINTTSPILLSTAFTSGTAVLRPSDQVIGQDTTLSQIPD